MAGSRKKPRQQTLDAAFRTPKAKAAKKGPSPSRRGKPSSPPPPQSSPSIPSSFMSKSKKKAVINDSSDEEPLSPRRAYRSSPPPIPETRIDKALPPFLPPVPDSGNHDDDDDDDDDDDLPIVTPARNWSSSQVKRKLVLDDSDDDSDDKPLVSSPTKKRRLVNRFQSKTVASSDAVTADDEPRRSRPGSARKTPRSKKNKAMELLRRKRAGEAIEEEDMTSSEGGENAKGVYDTDSDYAALTEFDDDEEGVPDHEEPASKPKARKADDNDESSSKKPRRNRDGSGAGNADDDDDDDDDSDDSMDDFVVEDDSAPIGAPALDIPLEFTAHAQKPLKEHFKNVVEWLIQLKINPGFPDKHSALYRMGWKKLNDSVSGLAQSKFSSSAWKTDFIMALRARPEITCEELPKGDASLSLLKGCDACGRSNHPATWVIRFSGSAYVKNSSADNFLDPIESDSDRDSADTDSNDEEEENSDDGDDDHTDKDEDGNYIANETKAWQVGVVCRSNAETAHTLMHWKHSLLDWVESTLTAQGYMDVRQMAERAKFTPKQRHRLVDKIRADWEQSGALNALYRDFKQSIEIARSKSVRGEGRRR